MKQCEEGSWRKSGQAHHCITIDNGFYSLQRTGVMSSRVGKEKVYSQACFMTKYGKSNATISELPEPTASDLKEGQVLLKIHAVSLNAVDWKTREGKIKAVSGDPTPQVPVVLGYDCSGTVEAVGLNVKEWAVGDEVFGVAAFGALASRRIVYADMLGRKPVGITHGEAASLVTAGVTALQMLDWAKEHAPNLNKVLITGGAGGTGHMAVQLAKKVFNIQTVVSTASSRNVKLVRDLGADIVIDYKAEDFVNVLRKDSELCDASLDISGEDKKCAQVTTKKGKHSMVVSIVAPGGGARIPSGATVRAIREAYHMPPVPGCILGLLNMLTDKTVETLVMLPFGKDLTRMAQYAAEGKIKVVVDRVYPFEKSLDAINYVEIGHVTGKCIVELVPGATSGLVPVNPQ